MHKVKSGVQPGTGMGRPFGRVMAVCVAMLILFAGTGWGNPASSYTNWPGTDTEWVSLTNHINWCYQTLVKRIQAVQPEVAGSTTNDIVPSYIYPYRDYLRFAQKIDELSVYFVCHTQAVAGVGFRDEFKPWFTNSLAGGSRATDFPIWGVTNLHQYAFGKDQWTTNFPLHSWMTITNRAIQMEVQSALTNLLWSRRVITASPGSGGVPTGCREPIYKVARTNYPHIDLWEDYPSGCSNDYPSAKSFQIGNWNNSVLTNSGGTIFTSGNLYGMPYYAVGYSLCPNINPPTVYGARGYSKLILENCNTNFEVDLVWYLRIDFEPSHPTWIQKWYNNDTTNSPYSWPDIQTNHMVAVDCSNGLRSTEILAGYPLYENRDVNPVSAVTHTSWPTGNQSYTCQAYANKAYWLLKWKFLDVPPPSIVTNTPIENPDTDADDLVEVPASMTSLGTDSGSIALTPQHDQPCVLLPVAAPPLWYGGLYAHAYISQGAFTNLPYHYLSESYDQDGYYTAYSMKTRVEESGILTNSTVHLKQVEIVRPRGNVVIFDFPWTGSAFSSKGYPVGANKRRSYVLVDRTPSNLSDKEYDLYFASGIIHSYAADGSLDRIKRNDGATVSPPGTDAGFSIAAGGADDGPASASDSRYDMTLGWDRGQLTNVTYTTKASPAEGNAVSLSLNSAKFIQGIAKSRFSESSASLNSSRDEVTYGSGVKVHRSASGLAGASRTVTLVSTVPTIGSATFLTEFNASDRVTRNVLSAGSALAVTQYTYSPFGSMRYNNGFLKEAKIAQVDYPNGAVETFTYNTTEGWLDSASMALGGGNTRKFAYSYSPANSGDAANSTNLVERPRKVEEQFNGTVVGCSLFSYAGIESVKEERCNASGAAWGATGNLRYESSYATNGVSSGLIQSSLSPLGSDSYSQTVSNGLLHTEQAHFDGRTFMTEINAFGGVNLDQVLESSQLTASVSNNVDVYGRPTTTTYRDGTTTVASYSTINGPDTVQNVDGATISLQYFANGLLKQVVDGSTGITTDYEVDPLGQPARIIRSGGGKTETEEFKFDGLGRVTSYKDKYGATTTRTYAPISGGGVTVTTIPSTGGSLVEKVYADGQLQEMGGSAAPARVTCERSVSGGQYKEKAYNTVTPAEYTAAYATFRGEVDHLQRSVAPSKSVAVTSDSKGRPVGVTDEESIALVQSLNAANRVELAGEDLNSNGAPDASSSDRIKGFQRSVSASGIKQEVVAYPSTGSGTTASLAMVQPALDELSGSFSMAGRTGTVTRSAFTAGGKYTVTINYADGTSEEQKFDKWRLDTAKRFNSSGVMVEKTVNSFDGLGNLEQVESLRNGVSCYTHYYQDSLGRVASIYGPDTTKGPVYVSYFGASTRIRRIVRSDGSVISFTYDDAGRVLSRNDNTGIDCDFAYDSQGRRTSMTTWQGGVARTTTWDYDSTTGLLTAKKINGTTVESYTHRDNGQVKTVTDANGVVATASFDAGGKMSGVVHSDGTASISRSFDRLGCLNYIGLSGGISETFTNNVEGLRLSTDATGGGVVSNAALTYSYSGAHGGLLSRASTISGLGTRNFAVSYNGNSAVAGITEGAVTGSYGYVWGSLVSSQAVTCAGGMALQKMVTWDYVNSRPTEIKYVVGSTLLASNTYQYVTNDDRIASIILKDGSSWKYQYDSRGHLISGKKYFADGSDWFGRQFAYAFDSVGNAIKAGPLAASGVPRYSFSSSGFNVHSTNNWGGEIEVSGNAATNTRVVVNRTLAQRKEKFFWATLTVSNSSAAVDQEIKIWVARTNAPGDLVGCVSGRVVVAKATEVSTYDNKLSKTADSRRQFVYNAMSWMIEAQNTGLTKPLKLKFDYYPDGRRARKVVLEQDGAGWKTNEVHQFYYDDWNMISESVVNSLGAKVYHYTWGLDLAGQRDGKLGQESGGIGGLLAITEVDGTTTNIYYPVADHIGSIQKLVSAQTGAVVAEYEYDPFGVLLFKNGAKAGVCPFRFSSKYYDSEIGLYYFGYRYYDPATTKWLTLDPLGEDGGVNLTCYCQNNPISEVDGLGLMEYSTMDRPWENSARLSWAQAEKPSEVPKEMLFNLASTFTWMIENGFGAPVRGGLSEAVDLANLGINGAKRKLNEGLGGGAGDAAEVWLVIGSGGMTKVPGLAEQVGAAGPKLEAALSRASSLMASATQWWQARRPLGATAGCVDFSVFSSKSIFWAGRWKGAISLNEKAAREFALATGGTVLDMTPAGKALSLSLDTTKMTIPEIRAAWSQLSLEYARTAAGEIHAFTGGAAVDSVWKTVELPALLKNSKVTKIVIHDAARPELTQIIYPR